MFTTLVHRGSQLNSLICRTRLIQRHQTCINEMLACMSAVCSGICMHSSHMLQILNGSAGGWVMPVGRRLMA